MEWRTMQRRLSLEFWFRVVINCEPNYHSSLLSFVATCFLEKLQPRGVWSVNFLARQLTGCKSTIDNVHSRVYIPETTSAYQGRVCGVNQSPRIVIHAIRPSWSCRNNFTNISCCLFIQGGKGCLTVSLERSMFKTWKGWRTMPFDTNRSGHVCSPKR